MKKKTDLGVLKLVEQVQLHINHRKENIITEALMSIMETDK